MSVLSIALHWWTCILFTSDDDDDVLWIYDPRKTEDSTRKIERIGYLVNRAMDQLN